MSACPAADDKRAFWHMTMETTATMPKMKTHSGAARRFRITAGGKVMRRRANMNHLLEHKSSQAHPAPGQGPGARALRH